MSQILVIYSNSWIRSMGKHTILHHNFQTKNSINNIACSLSLFEASRTKLPYLNTNKHKTHLGTWNRIFFDMQLLPFSELSSENTLQIRLNEDTRGSKIVRNSFRPPPPPTSLPTRLEHNLSFHRQSSTLTRVAYPRHPIQSHSHSPSCPGANFDYTKLLTFNEAHQNHLLRLLPHHFILCDMLPRMHIAHIVFVAFAFSLTLIFFLNSAQNSERHTKMKRNFSLISLLIYGCYVYVCVCVCV